MKYEYTCQNPKCKEGTIIIDKPMNDSDRVEICKVCNKELKRVYQASSIKTNDGFKS